VGWDIKKGTTKILIFTGIAKKEFYIESIQRDMLLPFLMETFPNGHHFQQDNDPKHKSTNSISDKTAKQPPNQITAKFCINFVPSVTMAESSILSTE